MKFPELEINNFLAITSAKLNLSDRGLVLIQGSNQADSSANSNGAGKSSIVDALCWCWFGTTARGVSGDDVINDDMKKDCFVRSVIQDGHMTYTATRYRKHKTGKNSFTLTSFDGMKEVELTKGTDKLTQEAAQAIIGCSLDVFSGSIYSGQEKMPDLPAMTDKGLKMLIEEAAGVTVLEAAYKKAREVHDEATKALEKAKNDVKSAEVLLDFHKGSLTTTKDTAANWDTAKIAREQDIRDRIAPLVPTLRDLRDKIALIDPVAVEAGIRDCDAKIAAVASQQSELRRYDSEIAAATFRVSTAEKSFNTASVNHAAAERDLKQVSHRIGCPCSECGRPLTAAELAAATQSAKDRLDTFEKAMFDAKKEHDSAKIALDDATSAREIFAASMTDISAVAAQRALFEKELAAYNDLLRLQSTASEQARNLRDALTAIGAEINPHLDMIEKINTRIDDATKQVASLMEQVVEKEKEAAIEAEVVKVYSPSGVRAHILDDVTPFLNAQTTKYLSVLSDGNLEAVWTTLTPDSKGNLKEKFTIDVVNSKGGKIFKLQSGGEKRKVRIATALALQDLVATRASKPIELYIGDEIDDALDRSGLERLMIVLESKAKERGSVFVISHNELKDYIKQIVLVEKLPNKTTRVTEMAA